MFNLYHNDNQEPFVFIRIPKVAGASLNTALLPWNDSQGVAHVTAKQARDSDPEMWDKCVSFTFVRNPWDRLVSWYSWQIQIGEKVNHLFFEEYINLLIKDEHNITRPTNIRKNWDCFGSTNKKITVTNFHTPKQLHYIVDSENSKISPANDGCTEGYNPFETYYENQILVDHIFKYEDIDNEWEKCCDLLKIPHQPLPKEHESYHKHYTEHYTNETRDIIGNFYKDDIERLGYKFGD